MRLIVALLLSLALGSFAMGKHDKLRRPALGAVRAKRSHEHADVPSHNLDMIYSIVQAHNGTVTSPESIKCDVCHYALKKAYSYGCGAAGGIISGLCMDFAPLCEAALKELCNLCETHCDVDNIINKVCTDVHLC